MPPKSARTPKLARKLAAVIVIIAGLAAVLYFATRPDAGSLKRQSRAAMERGDFALALELAERTLQKSPDDSEAAKLAGDAALSQADYAGALEFFDRVAQENSPQSIDARMKSGRILMDHLGRPSDAETQFLSVLKDDRNHPEALRELATLLGILARQREAVPFILRLLRQKQTDLDLLTLLGSGNGRIARAKLQALFRRHSPNDPSVSLATAWDAHNSHSNPDPNRALGILEGGVRKYPRFRPLRYALIELLWERRRLAELTLHLRICFDQGDVPPELWIIRGQLAERNHDLRGAGRCYWEAFRASPADRRAISHLSRIAFQLGQTKAAGRLEQQLIDLQRLQQAFDVVLNSEHESLAPLLRLVSSLEKVGRLWEAWGWCRIARKIDPGAAWPKEKSAALWARLERCPETPVCRADGAIGIDFSAHPLPAWSDWREPSSVASASLPGISFRDDAKQAGIQFRYFNSPSPPKSGRRMFEFPGGGCAAIDYDCDGWPDLYFTQGCRWPVWEDDAEHIDRLYRNLGTGRFDDVTQQAGLRENGFSGGVAVGDYDNDGFPDLYVANIGKNRLYRNQGDGTFDDVTEAADVGDPRWSTSCLMADLNGDSLPDIYSTNYLTGRDVFSRICRHDDGRPRMCMPFHFPGAQDQLYLNLGDGRFRNATAEAGIVARDGKGLGVVAADFTGDGRLDVFVANDTVLNFLFVNRSSGAGHRLQFGESALTLGVALNRDGRAEGCMGIAVGDADGDGRLDLFVTNFHLETNTLYLQQSPGMFADRTDEAGLAESSRQMLGFGTQFLDADLDGGLDLIATNGHIDDLRPYGRPYRMPTQFYYNRGGAKFVELPAASLGPFFQRKVLGRGLATLDWNRDGKEDAAIALLDGPAVLLTNTTAATGNALSVTFRGVESSRDAVGVTVRATIGSRSIVRHLTAGGGYQAANQQHVVIGMGAADRVDRLEVRWPSGRRVVFDDVSGNQELLLIENSSQLLVLPR